MNLYRLALRNLSGNAFRSWVVVLCAFLVTGLLEGRFEIAHADDQVVQRVQHRASLAEADQPGRFL